MKDLIIDMVVRQARAQLLAALPSFVGGPLSAILSIFLEKFVRMLVEKTALGLNFLYVDIQTEGQLVEYNKKMKDLEDAIFQGGKSEEEIDQMVVDFARKYYRIGRVCVYLSRFQDVQEFTKR